MSQPLPDKCVGDHLHLTARVVLAAIPVVGGPALELFNSVIAPPVERRRNVWLNQLAERLHMLEQEKRLRIEDLTNNQEFISAVLQATTAAVRNHQPEKLEALRNAVLNSALGQSPEVEKLEIFLAFVDQFTALHLRVLQELFKYGPPEGKEGATKTRVNTIAEVAMERISGLRGQQALAESVVEDLCRKGLLFWSGDQMVNYIPRGRRQVTELGAEFLGFISEPHDRRENGTSRVVID
jgi:hypothetical protein